MTNKANKNNYQPLVSNIKFYLVDDDGNSLENEDGTDKEFELKDGIRFKPLEYLCENLDVNMLEEIKKEKIPMTEEEEYKNAGFVKGTK